MALTWRIVDAGEFTCSCGAVYRKTIQRLPTPASDSATCSVCGSEMDRWNSTACLTMSWFGVLRAERARNRVIRRFGTWGCNLEATR